MALLYLEARWQRWGLRDTPKLGVSRSIQYGEAAAVATEDEVGFIQLLLTDVLCLINWSMPVV